MIDKILRPSPSGSAGPQGVPRGGARFRTGRVHHRGGRTAQGRPDVSIQEFPEEI